MRMTLVRMTMVLLIPASSALDIWGHKHSGGWSQDVACREDTFVFLGGDQEYILWAPPLSSLLSSLFYQKQSYYSHHYYHHFSSITCTLDQGGTWVSNMLKQKAWNPGKDDISKAQEIQNLMKVTTIDTIQFQQPFLFRCYTVLELSVFCTIFNHYIRFCLWTECASLDKCQRSAKIDFAQIASWYFPPFK